MPKKPSMKIITFETRLCSFSCSASSWPLLLSTLHLLLCLSFWRGEKSSFGTGNPLLLGLMERRQRSGRCKAQEMQDKCWLHRRPCFFFVFVRLSSVAVRLNDLSKGCIKSQVWAGPLLGGFVPHFQPKCDEVSFCTWSGWVIPRAGGWRCLAVGGMSPRGARNSPSQFRKPLRLVPASCDHS